MTKVSILTTVLSYETGFSSLSKALLIQIHCIFVSDVLDSSMTSNTSRLLCGLLVHSYLNHSFWVSRPLCKPLVLLLFGGHLPNRWIFQWFPGSLLGCFLRVLVCMVFFLSESFWCVIFVWWQETQNECQDELSNQSRRRRRHLTSLTSWEHQLRQCSVFLNK